MLNSVQWNLSIMDTIRTTGSVLIREVSLSQVLNREVPLHVQSCRPTNPQVGNTMSYTVQYKRAPEPHIGVGGDEARYWMGPYWFGMG